MTTRAGRICKTARSLLTVSTTRERTSPTTDASPPPTRRIRHMSARGRLAPGAYRTSPLSSPRIPIDVAKDERPTIYPAIPTAFALNSRAARPQKMKPRTALPMLPASTQPPCSRTRAASEIPSVERTGLIQGNSQPSMTPMNEGNEGGPIRITELAVERLFPLWKAARGHDPSVRGLRPGPNLQLEPDDRRARADRGEHDPREEPGRPNERG